MDPKETKATGNQSTTTSAPEQPKVESVGVEPKTLATKMGITPKRLRAMLRADHPRAGEDRGKRWLLDPKFAEQVESEYKAKQAKAEAEKKAAVAAQLAGSNPQDAVKPATQPATPPATSPIAPTKAQTVEAAKAKAGPAK